MSAAYASRDMKPIRRRRTKAEMDMKPIRRRRTKAEMDTIRQAILTITNGGSGMTVRHLFYRLVSAGVVEKTEAEYNGTVARLAVELRRSGDIPYGQIIDGSRLYSAPTTYNGIKDAIRDTASSYRRSYWRTADRQLEVWCEKDAIRALIEDTTWDLAVPLMVTRGFASESIVQSLAEDTKRSGKPRVILSLNDYDPSGSIMLNDIIQRARHYAPDARFQWGQVALTKEQVSTYNLPTRPTKTENNSHPRRFLDAESVELDALEPDVLREMLHDAIEGHIDLRAPAAMWAAEQSERQILSEMAAECCYSRCNCQRDASHLTVRRLRLHRGITYRTNRSAECWPYVCRRRRHTVQIEASASIPRRPQMESGAAL